jgi:hypothetical protein
MTLVPPGGLSGPIGRRTRAVVVAPGSFTSVTAVPDVVIRWWAALAFAGLLVGASAVLGLTALAGSLFALPFAVVGGWVGYRLWRRASARIVEGVYADVGGNPIDDDPPGADGRRAEDWHRGGSLGDSATDGGTEGWTPPESDDRWPWAGDFWRGGTDASDDATADATADASDGGDAAGGSRTGDARGDARDAGGPGGTDRWWERDDFGPGPRAGAGSGSGDGEGDGRGRRGASGDSTPRSPAVVEASETLGVEPDADPEVVRRAYRERVKETHPDTPGGSAAAFKRVRRAYDLLRERFDDDG